jgi:DNA polymerase I-like protein with 3'-5' exonuclease and polymerase domains
MASEDTKIRAQAERQAINTLVQGSASDLVKSSMVKIDKTITKKFKTKSGTAYMPAKLVLQMHDELIYEVNDKYIKEIQSIVRDCMENCMQLPVKMKVKVKVGKTWGTLINVT